MSSHIPLQVFQLSTLAELASLRLRWNELAAGVPMRTWEWHENWWRVYGNTCPTKRREMPAGHGEVYGKELYLLTVFEPPDRLIGIAPWYLEFSETQGRVMRFLGSGEVCTDYSTILCEPGKEHAVAEALAQTLCDPLHVADWLTNNHVRHWDRIEFEAVPTDDSVMQMFLRELSRQNNLVHRRPGLSCWQLPLPATWDEYLAQLSKSHRKQVRRAERELFATGRAKLCELTNEAEFDVAWERLVSLHQRRHQSLGKTGCFASPRFTTFHEELARSLFKAGMLRLEWLEFDGRVLASEYQFVGNDTVYAYQGGIEPTELELSPGWLMLLSSVKQAISEGRTKFDLMRGDEAFKAHWRALPTQTEDIRIVKRTASNQVRRGLWVAGDQVRSWLKNGLGLSGTANGF
jgi:CelD/BcsL family acetyltransferase involved in cellulose biosynthesis